MTLASQLAKVAKSNPTFAKKLKDELLKTSAKKFKKGDFVYDKKHNAIGEVLAVFDDGDDEVRLDSDGVQWIGDLEPLKTKHFKPGVHFAPSTAKKLFAKGVIPRFASQSKTAAWRVKQMGNLKVKLNLSSLDKLGELTVNIDAGGLALVGRWTDDEFDKLGGSKVIRAAFKKAFSGARLVFEFDVDDHDDPDHYVVVRVK
jgi:hypothetical protein